MEIKEKSGHILSIAEDKIATTLLLPLLNGKAYTAIELAKKAAISHQSAVDNLSKLVETQILEVEKQGAHQYYRVADGHVEKVREPLANLQPDDHFTTTQTTYKLSDIAFARTCYNHLAGEMGVQITTALIQKKIIQPVDHNYLVTDHGKEWFKNLGIDVEALKLKKSSFAHKCLDWTERKHHLAGALGNALLEYMLTQDWVRKKPDTRAIYITSSGRQELYDRLLLC